ncbi:MAG: sortase [Patescibacteria group bacterium]
MSTKNNDHKDRKNAVDMVRSKIDKLYANEPDAEEELKEALEPGKHSKHQLHLLKLHNSGLSMEEIQVQWHDYYASLNDVEKKEVWKEFYANQKEIETGADTEPARSKNTANPKPKATVTPHKPSSGMIKLADLETDRKKAERRARAEQKHANKKDSPRKTRTASSRPKKKLSFRQHLKSLGFGLAFAGLFLLVSMFTFFNERFITPFVRPGTLYASSQIITTPDATVSSDPRIIIPKLNIEAPVVYDVNFIQPGETEDDFEERVQTALEGGVVHYPTSQRPGEAGQGFNSNTVIVGHSSNNIFRRGNYKFAFMQLQQLGEGDTIMLNYNSKQYVYKIYEKKIIKPTEVEVLGAASRPNSVTLITCDPPGRNINRLVVVGEQISPDPIDNVLAAAPERNPSNVDAGQVPGQPDNMLKRFWNWLF